MQKNVAFRIETFVDMEAEQYNKFCVAARRTAEEYDFSVLTEKLISIVKECQEEID